MICLRRGSATIKINVFTGLASILGWLFWFLAVRDMSVDYALMGLIFQSYYLMSEFIDTLKERGT